MTGFFVHFGKDGKLDPEEAEFVLPSFDVAYTEAIAAAREIISHDILDGNPMQLDRVFQIIDARGSVRAEVTFAEAIPADRQST